VWQRELFPRFLLIGEASYLVFAGVMLLLISLAPAAAHPSLVRLALPPLSWSDGTALALPLAYGVGLVLAACVCLPSFYFYSLLAGVRMSWLQITSLVGKGMAANAVLLLGLLPVYVAVLLGMIVFEAPAERVQVALVGGLLLPFLVGPWGLWAIYRGVLSLSADLPVSWQHQRRCFLRRLTFSWAAVYAVVAPVMVYRLWGEFAGLIRHVVTGT
jgi:hypothetical protein